MKDKRIIILQEYLQQQPAIRLAILFGSYASGRARFESDIDLKVVGQPLLGQIVKHGIRLVGDDVRYGMLLSRSAFDDADFLPCRQRIFDIRRRSWIGC